MQDFKIKASWIELFRSLSDEDCGKLFKALCERIETGKADPLSGPAAFLWLCIERDLQKAEILRSNGKKRWGKKVADANAYANADANAYANADANAPANPPDNIGINNNDIYNVYINTNRTEKDIPELMGREVMGTREEERPAGATAEWQKLIPEKLNTPEFLAQWKIWEKHRREIGHKLTRTAVIRQFNLLAQLSVQEAINTIERSITAGYQGLFPDKKTTPKQQPTNSMEGI